MCHDITSVLKKTKNINSRGSKQAMKHNISLTVSQPLHAQALSHLPVGNHVLPSNPGRKLEGTADEVR